MFLQQLGILVIEIWIHEHHVHATWYQGVEYLKRSRGVQNVNKDVRGQDVLKRMPLCNSDRQVSPPSQTACGLRLVIEHYILSCCCLENAGSLTPSARTAAKYSKNNSTTISGCCCFEK